MKTATKKTVKIPHPKPISCVTRLTNPISLCVSSVNQRLCLSIEASTKTTVVHKNGWLSVATRIFRRAVGAYCLQLLVRTAIGRLRGISLVFSSLCSSAVSNPPPPQLASTTTTAVVSFAPGPAGSLKPRVLVAHFFCWWWCGFCLPHGRYYTYREESVHLAQGCDRCSALDSPRTGRYVANNAERRVFGKNLVESLPKTYRWTSAPLPLPGKQG